MEKKEKVIKVERETFEYKGKSFFEYFISGKVRGKEVKIKLAPPNINDRGGYTVLDIVFGNEDKADFVVEPYEFKDASGNTITGNKFLVRTVDKETGETFESSIKPARNSDKTLLAMLMR
ncbi:MAG: hypothetical protein NC311_08555 [Muribaculaceae bacterium]|nr:hypothetical protein [Muribaculaceae bacterium]